jgi:hypothetical protein
VQTAFPDPALLARVLERVARITLFVSAGVLLANVAVAMGAVERVAGLSRHLTGPANLPDEVGTAIVTTAASTTAGYGMLAEFRESGRLDDRATLVAVTVNTFFGFIQHVVTYYVPVLIPILGLRTGLLYVGARAAVALGITLLGVVAGALLLPDDGRSAGSAPASPGSHGPAEPESTGDVTDDDGTGPSRRAAVVEAWGRTRSTLRRIVPRLVLVYALVALLVARVDLRAATGAADPFAALLGLPGAAVPVVAVFVFDTTAGAAAIAPLVGDPFTPRTAVATLLVGGILSFAVSTFKRSIPFQYGVWGASFGSKVVLVNTATKVVFIGLALAVLLGA